MGGAAGAASPPPRTHAGSAHDAAPDRHQGRTRGAPTKGTCASDERREPEGVPRALVLPHCGQDFRARGQWPTKQNVCDLGPQGNPN